MMTVRYPIADNRCQIDLAWQTIREQFLDNGHEPQPLDWASIAFVSAFFAVTWSLSTWEGLVQMIPAITAVTTISFACLRYRGFDRAYLEYRQKRTAATAQAAHEWRANASAE